MSVFFCPLFSGSGGNSIFIASHSTRILVDAGVSAKRICEELSSIGANAADIDAILITHEHIDHIRGIGVLARKFGCQIYANAATWQAIECAKLSGFISPEQKITFCSDEDFYIGDLGIEPIRTSHDAAEPVCYNIWSSSKKLSVATDMGFMPSNILGRLKGSSIVLLESNHDVDMLKYGNYPAQLKRRILSNKGHLSNDAAADALLQLAASGTSHIMLGHLSKENNTPAMAYSTSKARLAAEGIIIGSDIELALAPPDFHGECWVV